MAKQRKRRGKQPPVDRRAGPKARPDSHRNTAPETSAQDVLGFQRSIGNRAAAQLLGSTPVVVQRNPPEAIAAPDEASSLTWDMTAEARQSEAAAEPEQVYRFTYDGQEYELPPGEYDLVVRACAQRIQTQLLPAARTAFNNNIDQYNYHVRIFNRQRIVGSLIGLFANDLPSTSVAMARAFLKNADTAVAALDEPTPGKLNAATAALQLVESHNEHVENALKAYRDSVVSVGETYVTGLKITETACFTIACVAGGAALALPAAAGGAGLGLASSSAIAGGGTALVQAMAGTAGRGAAGEDLDMAEEIFGWGKAAARNALAGAAGGVLAGKISGRVAAGIAEQLGPQFANMSAEALELAVKGAIEGSAGNTLQGAMVDVVAAFEGEITAEDFVLHVITNLIAGGIAGAITPGMPVTRGG